MAKELLSRIPSSAVRTLTTTFQLPGFFAVSSMVTLLHLAAYWGWGSVVFAIVSVYDCVCNSKDDRGRTPLHYAAYNGQIEIVKYFTDELNCDPMESDNTGWTALYFACRYGYFDIVLYLIKEQGCNPSCENKWNSTPLHLACNNGYLDIAKYLIEDKNCDPSCENRFLQTPLHFACQFNQTDIVKYLLSTGRVNPLAKDERGFDALYWASGNYDTIKLFERFKECRTAFPVHMSTKLILTGDSGAGKTTTAKHLVYIAKQASSDVPVDCLIAIDDVERYTAGIIPHFIESSEQLSNFVMYDFAGQQEYYSSHAAVLEQVMRRSAAIFICLIDLRKSDESISESLYYWLSFIDNACSATEEQSHVLVIGSHADQVGLLVEEKRKLLQTIVAKKIIQRQVYVGCIAMDCRRTNTDASNHLIATLTNSQKIIAASQPVIHYYSHVVYAFLRTKLTVVGCTLHDLVWEIDEENDSSLPSDQSVLTDILTTLSDKGLIHFMHNCVVVKTNALLKEINGTLFAPCQFKEYRDTLASNTGIVSTSSLLSVFPHYNTDMLVGFLQSLDFCQPVEPAVLENTNLQTTPPHSTADLLFFPGLVKSERPDCLVEHGALGFGWCLRCVDPHEFFSSRFLHVLLLLVAYKFPLASQGLHRVCRVWRNGIFWRNYDDITTVIELLDNNRCVLVAMSCNDSTLIEHAELCSSLIGLVRHVQQQYCPHLNVREFLISPDLIQRYPLDNLPDSDLFDIHHVAQCVLLRKSVVPSYRDSSGRLPVQSLPFEPYHLLSSSSVSQLLNPVMADQPVPSSILHEIRRLCHHSKVDSLVYKELREHLDKLSLFAGRNPLVSCTVACDGSNVSLVCTGGG